MTPRSDRWTLGNFLQGLIAKKVVEKSTTPPRVFVLEPGSGGGMGHSMSMMMGGGFNINGLLMDPARVDH